MELISPVRIKEELQNDISSFGNQDNMFLYDVLSSTILKKYVPVEQDHALHDLAIQDFLDRNQQLSKAVDLSTHRDVLEVARDKLHSIFLSGEYQSNVLTLNACVSKGYAGPGSSRAVRHTDFVNKMFNSDITTTSNVLYKHYVSALSQRWLEAEFSRLSIHSVKVVSGSSLTTVPKDAARRRTICTEPSLNMFYQLGAKAVIEDLLMKNFKFDMSKQPSINKLLACSGSISDLNATIDLKNASDSLSIDLVRYLLPKETFSVLEIIRSKSTSVNGTDHDLNMISTMGNGFTFPLMTLIFIVLVDSCLRRDGDKYTPYRDGVFGDDIILPNTASTYFISLLNSIGFEVNLEKSYTTGPFRESCGGDFLKGRDVRGLYLKRLSHETDCYSAFNRLLDWSLRHSIRIPNLLSYLKGSCRFRPVPFDESDDSGFKIPFSLLRAPKFDCNGAVYYHAVVSKPRTLRFTDNFHNPHGALLGALGGYVRDNRTNVRSDERSVKVAKRKTPSWDFVPSPYYTSRDSETVWLELFNL